MGNTSVCTVEDTHPVEGSYTVCLSLLYDVGSLVGSSLNLVGRTVLADTLASVSTIFTDDARNAFADELIVDRKSVGRERVC